MRAAHLRSRIVEKLKTLRLSQKARAVRSDRLTYLSATKLYRLERALKQIEQDNVAGDIVEFGVALGGSAVLMAAQACGERRFFGLDVFSMIPEPKSEKDDAASKARYRLIANGKSGGIGDDLYYGYRNDLLDYVTEQLKRYGTPVDNERVTLVQGLFEQTWPTLDIDRVAIAHIDCDWYDPVAFALEAARHRLSPGGLIVVDDYNDYKGCRTAVDEFLADNRDFVMMPGENPILYRSR
jgi:O-methyltransferase